MSDDQILDALLQDGRRTADPETLIRLLIVEVGRLNARIDEIRAAASASSGIVSQAVIVLTETTGGVMRIKAFGSPDGPGHGAEEYADQVVGLLRAIDENGPIRKPAEGSEV